MAVQTQRPGQATLRLATTLRPAGAPGSGPSLVAVGASGLLTGLVAGTMLATGGDVASAAALMVRAVRLLAVMAGVIG